MLLPSLGHSPIYPGTRSPWLAGSMHIQMSDLRLIRQTLLIKASDCGPRCYVHVCICWCVRTAATVPRSILSIFGFPLDTRMGDQLLQVQRRLSSSPGVDRLVPDLDPVSLVIVSQTQTRKYTEQSSTRIAPVIRHYATLSPAAYVPTGCARQDTR